MSWAPAGGFAAPLALALTINLVLATAALRLGVIDRGGALVGALLGTAVWFGGGPRAFALLTLFVALGALVTRLGWARKARAGIAEAGGGRRGAAHALAKVSVPALAALALRWPTLEGSAGLAFVGALATAAADTVSTEIGQAFGRRTVRITTLRPVPPGTDGAVSGEGTLAGLATALAFAAAGVALGLYPLAGALAVAAAAVAANVLESFAGATLERRGRLGHDVVNFLAALVGALLAAAAGT